MKQALAMVETKGFVAAMEAADAALKSASVELLGWKKVGGGLVAIFFTGDVQKQPSNRQLTPLRKSELSNRPQSSRAPTKISQSSAASKLNYGAQGEKNPHSKRRLHEL